MGMTNFSSATPWLRRIEVALGPLEEWRGASRGEVVRFTADGTPGSLRVTGAFQKGIMGIPQPSALSVHNLARDTRDAVRGGLTKCAVRAGWENTEMHTLFQGSVLSVVSERSGPDIVTRISALPGYGALVRGVSSRTFGRGTPVRKVVETLAADLPGVAVADADLAGLEGVVGPGGWSFAGSTKDALTQLATEYGFSWQVDDGALKAVGDAASFGSVTELSGGGLISVSPVLAGPMQIVTGVKIKALYAPGVTAGSGVRVVSAVSPKLNGTYRVSTVNVTIDSHGESWTMDIESMKNPGVAP